MAGNSFLRNVARIATILVVVTLVCVSIFILTWTKDQDNARGSKWGPTRVVLAENIAGSAWTTARDNFCRYVDDSSSANPPSNPLEKHYPKNGPVNISEMCLRLRSMTTSTILVVVFSVLGVTLWGMLGTFLAFGRNYSIRDRNKLIIFVVLTIVSIFPFVLCIIVWHVEFAKFNQVGLKTRLVEGSYVVFVAGALSSLLIALSVLDLINIGGFESLDRYAWPEEDVNMDSTRPSGGAKYGGLQQDYQQQYQQQPPPAYGPQEGVVTPYDSAYPTMGTLRRPGEVLADTAGSSKPRMYGIPHYEQSGGQAKGAKYGYGW